MSDVKRHDPIQGDILHEYDGIEEADNQLPRWWLATFFGTVAFAVVYYQLYETWHLAPSTREVYAAEMAEQLTAGGDVTDDALVTLSQDSTTVESGHQTFVTNCVVCHGDQAQGNIGPNLTDDHWIHGGAPTDIYGTVRDGVGTRGMPQWGPVLGDRALQSVVAYVLTLRDTNVPGRAPEGDVYVPGGAAPATGAPAAEPTPSEPHAAADAPAADAPAAGAAEADTTGGSAGGDVVAHAALEPDHAVAQP